MISHSRRRSNPRRGRAFEWQVRRELEDCGFYVVRSAGSRGIADLVALSKDAILLVQCKAGRSGVTRGEIRALYELGKAVWAVPVLAIKRARSKLKYRIITGTDRLDYEEHEEIKDVIRRKH